MGQWFINLKNRLLALLGGKPGFRNSDEVFAAARRLFAGLREAGYAEAAAEAEAGFAGLNGLTDGWAFFLEHLEKAGRLLPDGAAEFKKELDAIIRAARYAVYRS